MIFTCCALSFNSDGAFEYSSAKPFLVSNADARTLTIAPKIPVPIRPLEGQITTVQRSDTEYYFAAGSRLYPAEVKISPDSFWRRPVALSGLVHYLEQGSVTPDSEIRRDIIFPAADARDDKSALTFGDIDRSFLPAGPAGVASIIDRADGYYRLDFSSGHSQIFFIDNEFSLVFCPEWFDAAKAFRREKITTDGYTLSPDGETNSPKLYNIKTTVNFTEITNLEEGTIIADISLLSLPQSDDVEISIYSASNKAVYQQTVGLLVHDIIIENERVRFQTNLRHPVVIVKNLKHIAMRDFSFPVQRYRKRSTALNKQTSLPVRGSSEAKYTLRYDGSDIADNPGPVLKPEAVPQYVVNTQGAEQAILIETDRTTEDAAPITITASDSKSRDIDVSTALITSICIQEKMGFFVDNPFVIAEHQERMWVAGFQGSPARLFGSCIGEYNRFSPTSHSVDEYGKKVITRITSPNDAIVIDIAGERQLKIAGLVSYGNDLIALFNEAIYAISPGDNSGGIAPGNFRVQKAATVNCADIKPAQGKNGEVFFVDAQKKRVYVLYRASGGYRVIDLGLQGRHLLEEYGGVEQIEITHYPNEILWARMNNGRLLSCTWAPSSAPDRNIQAWTKHTTPFQERLWRMRAVQRKGKQYLFFLVPKTTRPDVDLGIYYMDLTQGQTRGSTQTYRYVDTGIDGTEQEYESMIELAGVPRQSLNISTGYGGRDFIHSASIKRLAIRCQAMRDIDVAFSPASPYRTSQKAQTRQVIMRDDENAETRLFSGVLELLVDSVSGIEDSKLDASAIGQIRLRVQGDKPMNILSVSALGEYHIQK